MQKWATYISAPPREPAVLASIVLHLYEDPGGALLISPFLSQYFGQLLEWLRGKRLGGSGWRVNNFAEPLTPIGAKPRGMPADPFEAATSVWGRVEPAVNKAVEI